MFAKVKNNPLLSFGLIWILVSAVGVYFRLYPLKFFVPSVISEKATVLVLHNLRNTVRQQIEKRFSFLGEDEKTRLAKERFDEVLHEDRAMVRATIDEIAQSMAANQTTGKKEPYLLASDSYYYYGLTENILQAGHISDTVRGSKYLNKRMLAPLGHWEPFNLHPFVGYGIYKILSFIDPSVSLMYAVSFTPLVIIVLALIPFLFLCRQIKSSGLIALIGAIFFVLAPIAIKRSTFGWYDNDPYNILFPLIILAFLFIGLDRYRDVKQNVLWAFFTALGISLYALFWQGWVYLLGILMVSGALIVPMNHFLIKEKKHSPLLLLYFGTMTCATLIGVAFIFGWNEFFVLFAEGWVALKNFLFPKLALWPDLYIAVGELRGASWGYFLEYIGKGFMYIALFGLLAGITRSQEKDKALDPFKLIVLVVFLAFTVVITLGAQRFILLCLIPLSLFFVMGLQKLFSIGRYLLEKHLPPLRFKNICLKGVGALAAVFLIWSPIRYAHKSTLSLTNPIFNHTWDEALRGIAVTTEKDSIINTWWPPGHFITAMTKRRVTFDGATVNYSPQGFWIANVFLSTDERQAAGILRMLNTSANKAIEYLTGQGLKLSMAVDILKDIVALNEREARRRLEIVLTPDQAGQVLNFTHQDSPPAYFLVYNEMAEKNMEFSFVGRWDFKKIEALNANASSMKEIPPRNSKAYIQFLWMLAGGPPKYSGPLTQVALRGNTAFFEQGVTIDLKEKVCRVMSPKFGEGIPRSIFYLEKNTLVEKTLPYATLGYSVLLLKDNGHHRCILLERELARSLLVRLFFLSGKGLKYFKPHLYSEDLTKRTQIYVYKVDWDALRRD